MELLFSPGVDESQSGSMKGLAVDREGFDAIKGISEERVTEMGQVDTNLMGPASPWFHFKPGSPREASLHQIIGQGRFPSCGPHNHFLPVEESLSDRLIDFSFIVLDHPPNDGLVGSINLVIFKLKGKEGMGGIIFGDHEKARSVFIKTMNNPGPDRSSHLGKISDVIKQGVD